MAAVRLYERLLYLTTLEGRRQVGRGFAPGRDRDYNFIDDGGAQKNGKI
jgi:hypothetical protein